MASTPSMTQTRSLRGQAAAWWACGLLSAPIVAVAAEPVPPPPQLEQAVAVVRQAIGPDGYLGAVTLVARHGQVLDWRAYGWRDLARREPMPRDAIFRIYSMSKSVAAIAALTLVDGGRLALDDPVARYLPEFEPMAVLGATAAGTAARRPAARPITVRHLLTHTPGFATGGPGTDAASDLLEQARLHESSDLRDYALRVARLPLAADPGERYRYDGVQFEVLGRVLEVASGGPLDLFLQQALFAPLKMVDTGFSVPASQRTRIAELSTLAPDGRVVAAPVSAVAPAGTMMRPYFSVAGGLYSTAGDFMRLCQMLLEGGALDGVRVLSRSAVDSMFSPQWRPAAADAKPGSAVQLEEGVGVGLGGWVIVDAPRRQRAGSVGAYGWSGAASTYFMVDPKLQLVALLLLQHLPADGKPGLPKINAEFFARVVAAVTP